MSKKKISKFGEWNDAIGKIHQMNKEKRSRDVSSKKINLELTHREAKSLLQCLIQTNASGDDLDIGMEIEDRIVGLLEDTSTDDIHFHDEIKQELSKYLKNSIYDETNTIDDRVSQLINIHKNFINNNRETIDPKNIMT